MPSFSVFYQEKSIWRTWNNAPLVLSTILKDFITSFIVESKIFRNHWLRNYFVKLVNRGECNIIGTRLTMFGRRIVEFLHKRTRQIFSLLAFGELASVGFFHWTINLWSFTSNGKYVCFCSCPTCRQGRCGYLQKKQIHIRPVIKLSYSC